MPQRIEVSSALALITAMVLGGCTQARETPTVTQQDSPSPPPTPRSEVRSGDSTPLEATAVESAALACDGATLTEMGLEKLAALDPATLPPSAALLATWESARAFTAEGTLEPAAVEALTEAVTTALDHAPPTWWREQLASAQRREGSEPPFYDAGVTKHGDRRGAWKEGPGGLRVRSGATDLLVEQDGQLAYDFSVARAELGPIPSEPGTALEHTRAHAGSTVYFAMFPVASGGFPFPLQAVTNRSEKSWTAQVCGPKRTALNGLGHLTVELVVLEDPPSGRLEMTASPPPSGVAVFTAETHGVALEVFDVETGKRTLAWSSDLWFSRT